MYLIAIAAFCTAYYIVNVIQFAMAIKKAFKLNPQRRLKPLDCVQCLSVWLALVLYFSPIEISQALSVIFGAGFIATRIK